MEGKEWINKSGEEVIVRKKVRGRKKEDKEKTDGTKKIKTFLRNSRKRNARMNRRERRMEGGREGWEDGG